MKENTYVKLLDTFTWTVVGLLALYIILWIIENYDVKSIDLSNDAAKETEIDDIPVNKPVVAADKAAAPQQPQNKSKQKKPGKK